MNRRQMNTFTWSGPRGVAGYTEARTVSAAVMPTGPLGSLTPCSLMIPKKSNHVGTVRGVLEIIPADPTCAPETVPLIITIIIHLRGRPPEGRLVAPDTARMRGWAWSPLSVVLPFEKSTI
jgi:hypothetical protein